MRGGEVRTGGAGCSLAMQGGPGNNNCSRGVGCTARHPASRLRARLYSATRRWRYSFTSLGGKAWPVGWRGRNRGEGRWEGGTRRRRRRQRAAQPLGPPPTPRKGAAAAAAAAAAVAATEARRVGQRTCSRRQAQSAARSAAPGADAASAAESSQACTCVVDRLWHSAGGVCVCVGGWVKGGGWGGCPPGRAPAAAVQATAGHHCAQAIPPPQHNIK